MILNNISTMPSEKQVQSSKLRQLDRQIALKHNTCKSVKQPQQLDKQ